MPNVSTLRCPECNAALKPPSPGQLESKCEYCGVVARIPGNRTQQIKAVIQTAVARKPAQPFAKPATWIIIVVLAPFVLPFVFGIFITIVAIIMAIVGGESLNTGTTGGESIPPGANLQWNGSNAAMLYDVNGDGITDPIGYVRLVGADVQSQHLAAFDSVTGKRLWITEAISDLSSGPKITAALTQDTLLYVDPTGVIKALAPATGQLLWSAPLGERAERICAPTTGFATVELADKRLVNVQLATGQISAAGQADDSVPCIGVWSDEPGLTPTSRIDDWRSRIHGSMPEVPGIQIDKLVRDSITGAVVGLGYRTPGTRVPAAASIVETTRLEQPNGKAKKRSPQPKVKVEARWVSNVPAQNPLSVSEGEPDTAVIAVGRLVVPYEMTGSPSAERLACLDIATGRPLWDVEIPKSDTGDVSAVVANDRLLFVSIWTYLHIFDLATGEYRTTIGTWM